MSRPMALAKFTTITAMSWRLRGWSGWNLPPPTPWTTPASEAQFTAALAQWEAGTSEKLPRYWYWASSLEVRTVRAIIRAKAPRVSFSPGEKVVLLVPWRMSR